ncbi:MAG: type II toxin-antitoxin system Phd/YefM family antitoxin [Pseudohongiella sp.]|nr:type II toxin-antitoxin system Phd/YefM family antitoxin [Pseudohongiella sp.]
MHTVNIHEAKAHLSELLARVEAGETVVIARRNKPIVKLVPADVESPKEKRRLGLAEGSISISDNFFDPMTEEELADWYGIKPTDPLHPDWKPEP